MRWSGTHYLERDCYLHTRHSGRIPHVRVRSLALRCVSELERGICDPLSARVGGRVNYSPAYLLAAPAVWRTSEHRSGVAASKRAVRQRHAFSERSVAGASECGVITLLCRRWGLHAETRSQQTQCG